MKKCKNLSEEFIRLLKVMEVTYISSDQLSGE